MANKIFGNGMLEADLVDLIVAFRAAIIGIQTKLDSDGGVNDTDYHTNAATTLAALPAGIQTTGVKCIHNQGVTSSILSDIATKWNATLTKLDSDSQVTDVNFNSLWAVKAAENGATKSIPVGNSKIDGVFDAGQYQSSIVAVLNTILASINGVAAKLDLDAGVSDTNYGALWAITDTVIEGGTSQRIRIAGTSSFLWALFALSALLGPWKPAQAANIVEGDILNSSVTTNQAPVFDAGMMDRFSVQASYSNGTPSGTSFTDGRKSTDTINVSTAGPILVGQSIAINGVTFVFGVNIATAATTTLQAQQISSAIINSASLQGVITSSFAASVVYATASLVGLNPYVVFSSTVPGVTWGAPIFANGLPPDYDYTTGIFTKAAHPFVTGLQVLMSSVSATTPVGGLFAGTTYYVIRNNENAFKLATSTTNAVAGTAITISSNTGGDTWNLTPPALSTGVAGMFWQISNDNINWSNEPTLTFSSVTYSAAGNSAWDFQFQNYRYIRPFVTAPTAGAINWKIRLRGKGDFN